MNLSSVAPAQQASGNPQAAGNSNFATQAESWLNMTPADLLRGVGTRLPSVVFTTLLVTAVVIGLLIVWPNQFSSDGLMYVRLGRAALSIDPTAQNSGSDGVSIQETRSSEVMSIVEMIDSREIAERVVNQVGTEAINQPRSWFDHAQLQLAQWLPGKSVHPPGEMTVDEYEKQIAHEEAIKKVHSWLSVDAPKNGYTVSVAANGPDALLMQDITQAVMDQYRRYHVEAHRSDGSMEFFEQQVAQSRQTAVEARDELQQARSKSGWMSIESAESTLRDRMVALEVSYDDAQSKYAESQQRAASLKQQLAKTIEWIPTEVTKGVANVASDSIRTQLFGEQVEESEQLATLKPTHPRYRLLQEKMSRSEQIATGENEDRELTRESLNPIWQQLESAFTLEAAAAQGLASKCESLKKSLAETRVELLRLNDDAVTLSQLKWQADIAEKTLMGHAQSLEEARIIFELDRKHMSDVTVIQDASLNLKKVGPPRTLLTLVGCALGLALGLFQAMLRVVPSVGESQSRGHCVIETRSQDHAVGAIPETLSDKEFVTQDGAHDIAQPALASANRGNVLPR